MNEGEFVEGWSMNTFGQDTDFSSPKKSEAPLSNTKYLELQQISPF